MQIKTLTPAHFRLFSSFIPEDVLIHLGLKGYYSLGAFNENCNMYPCGYLQFYSGFYEHDPAVPMLQIKYLYVREDSRYEGVGKSLVDKVLSIAEESGAKLVYVIFPQEKENQGSEGGSSDSGLEKAAHTEANTPHLATENADLTAGEVPRNSGLDIGADEGPEGLPEDEANAFAERKPLSPWAALKHLFVKTGFSLEQKNWYQMEMPLAKYEEIRILEGIPEKNVKALMALGREEWNKLLSKVQAEQRSMLKEALRDNDKVRYDFRLSGVYEREGNILGLMLVRQFPSGPLELLYLRTFEGADARAMFSMLKHLETEDHKGFTRDQMLRIEGHDEASENLIHKLFPKYVPEKMIKGIRKIS